MNSKEMLMLQEAYIAIRKSQNSNFENNDLPSTDPNEVVSAGPVDEPAPGVDMDMIDSEVEDTSSEEMDTTGMPVSLTSEMPFEDPRLSEEDENEEDEMAISNLNSIRESLMKIAAHVASGDHLEPWQQQKLAIAMDNLAEVARRI